MRKYKIGEIVRWNPSNHGLMKIQYFKKDLSQKSIIKYYGIAYYGGVVNCFDYELKPATLKELHKWKTDDSHGRLEELKGRI